jgi:hypothetical protein
LTGTAMADAAARARCSSSPAHEAHLRRAGDGAASKERKRPKISSAQVFVNHYSLKYLSVYYTNLMQNDCIKADELALELADYKNDLQQGSSVIEDTGTVLVLMS